MEDTWVAGYDALEDEIWSALEVYDPKGNDTTQIINHIKQLVRFYKRHTYPDERDYGTGEEDGR